MTEEEYKECRYIDNDLKFYTYRDFKRNAFYLRALYDNLKHKLFYRWYIYANIHLSIKQKDIAWSFLNHDVGYTELDNYD